MSTSVTRQPPIYSRPDIALHFHKVSSARARILWLVIVSHASWEDPSKPAWASNVTLTHETGLDLRVIRRGLRPLEDAGLMTSDQGMRPGSRRATGRVFNLALSQGAKVHVPDRQGMARLWALTRSRRSRCAPLVLAAIGAHALACDHAGRVPTAAAPVGCSQGDWRRLIGATKGSQWSRIVADLEHREISQGGGREVWVTPTSTWSPTRIAMRDMPPPPRRTVEPDMPPLPVAEPPGWWEDDMRVMA